jgi:hypothetical protein
MDEALRDLVTRRTQERCEYCLLGQRYSQLRHHDRTFALTGVRLRATV